MAPLLVAFGVIFVAELGDKSQLMTLAFAARERASVVLGGLALAVGVLNLLAVTVGAMAADRLPTTAMSVAGGLAFLGFAVWTVVGDDDPAHDDAANGPDTGQDAVAPEEPAPSRSRLVTIAAAYFVAELGDKTQLATVTLATQRPAAAVWLGATSAIVAANIAAVIVGRVLHRRLPAHVLRYGAAGLFAVFGAVLVYDGVRG